MLECRSRPARAAECIGIETGLDLDEGIQLVAQSLFSRRGQVIRSQVRVSQHQ
jgi:hypothetical protein